MSSNRSLPILDDVKKRDIERQLRVLGYKDVPDDLVQELLEELHNTTEEEYLSLLNDEESFDERSSSQETFTTTEASSSYDDTDDDFEDSRWTDEEFGDESQETSYGYSYSEEQAEEEESVDESNVNTDSEEERRQVPPLSYPTAVDPNFEPYVPEKLRESVHVPHLQTATEQNRPTHQENNRYSSSSRRRPTSAPVQQQRPLPSPSPSPTSSRSRYSSPTFSDRKPTSSRSGVIYQYKPKRKKSDPVARYHQMQQVWKRDRFLANSSSNHKHLRWRVRCQMLAGEG